MAKPKLSYFDSASSRGEECRLAFVVAGVDFEDNRLSSSDWSAFKPETPFGALPVLELEGKPMVSQSNAILMHIGRRHGLLAEDEWEATRLHSLMDACEDLRHAVTGTFDIQDATELQRRRQELTEAQIRPWGAQMERQIVGPFAGGESISVADIKLFVMLRWFKKGVLDHVPADVLNGLPKLETLFQRVQNHPRVVAWYAR